MGSVDDILYRNDVKDAKTVYKHTNARRKTTMRKYNMFKCWSCFIAVVMLLSVVVPVHASSTSSTNSYKEFIDLLVKNGYTYETAAALSLDERNYVVNALKKDSENVDIVTTGMEIDQLAEIESLYAYSEEELKEMGADMDSIHAAKEEFNSYYKMSNADLAEELAISEVEAKIIKMAIKNGKERKSKNRKQGVSASGSISSSKLTYTQTVSKYTLSGYKLAYMVTISYAWANPYTSFGFDDVIAVAWGGGYMHKSKSDWPSSYSSANIQYYGFDISGWKSYKKTKNYLEDIIITNAAISFSFPQSLSNDLYKTKRGSATVPLYLNSNGKNDTYVLSNYCHRVLSVGGGISASVSGPSVSLTIGTKYDKTPQKKTMIKY